MMTEQTAMDLKPYEDRRDLGILRAATRADKTRAGWVDDACMLIIAYAEANPILSFLTEDVVAWAKDKIDDPPDKRAWGAAVQKAHKLEKIQMRGYAPSKSSNLSPKCLWGAA